MIERFGCSVKEQADGNTGTKKHHEVGLIGELRVFVGFAQLDVTIAISQVEL